MTDGNLAYRKEDCTDDPGWCFTAAVGKALPSTFFSYGVPSSGEPSQLPGMSTLIGGMTLPQETRDTETSTDNSYRPFSDQLDTPEAPAPFEASTGYQQYSPPAYGTSSGSAEQAASLRGYTDGFLTARIFSLYSLSKLGFVGQYVQDSISALGPAAVAPGTNDAYQSGFLYGLADGEAVVNAGLGDSP